MQNVFKLFIVGLCFFSDIHATWELDVYRPKDHENNNQQEQPMPGRTIDVRKTWEKVSHQESEFQDICIQDSNNITQNISANNLVLVTKYKKAQKEIDFYFCNNNQVSFLLKKQDNSTQWFKGDYMEIKNSFQKKSSLTALETIFDCDIDNLLYKQIEQQLQSNNQHEQEQQKSVNNVVAEQRLSRNQSDIKIDTQKNIFTRLDLTDQTHYLLVNSCIISHVINRADNGNTETIYQVRREDGADTIKYYTLEANQKMLLINSSVNEGVLTVYCSDGKVVHSSLQKPAYFLQLEKNVRDCFLGKLGMEHIDKSLQKKTYNFSTK